MNYLAVLLMLAVMPLAAQSAPTSFRGNFINNQGEIIGTLTLRHAPKGVLFEIDIYSLPPGKHGMHLHAIGDCSDHERFQSSGGHVMPRGRAHGFLHPRGPHAGDLPNLIVGADGAAHIELYSPSVRLDGRHAALRDGDGSAIVIHAESDDYRSQPIGGAGARIACAEIK